MFAIHRVNYDDTLSHAETQGVVRAIEHHGYILPHGELVRQGLSGNMCFGLDYLAGDCEYVFLKPVADDWQGWLRQFNITDAFVFDLDTLMAQGALYGMHDLLENYTTAGHDVLLTAVGDRVEHKFMPIFYDILVERVNGVSMSAGAKRTHNILSHGTKLSMHNVIDDIIAQDKMDFVIEGMRECCAYFQRSERFTGQFGHTVMSRDSIMLSKLLQIAQKEGWKSQHALAHELTHAYRGILAREVLFPGPLPVSLAISCP